MIVDTKGALSSEKWENYANSGKLIAGASGVAPRTLTVSFFDVPMAGAGLELTLCYNSGKCTLVQPF